MTPFAPSAAWDSPYSQHMLTPTSLLVDALATYRGTRLIVEDKVAEPIRDKIWETFDVENSYLGYLISCPFCASVWVGGAIAAANMAAPKLSKPLRYALALSAVTCMYEDWRHREE
jgi:hypothetical protein